MLNLKILTTTNKVDEISELLHDYGALAVTLADAANQPIYEPDLGTVVLWQKTCVIGLFHNINIPALITQLKTQITADFSYQIEKVPDENWVELTQKNFPPLQIGKKLWICPAWEKIAVTGTVVLLNPGLAFGTGTHATTSLCLAWLEKNIKSKESLIDYGCGSGILAIAALQLGAQQAWAIDLDPQALEATSANAKLNHLSGSQLTTATPNQLPPWQADILVANILAEPLIKLAPLFARLIKPGGKLALSGILETQTEAVITAYQPWFSMKSPLIQEGWVLLAGTLT